MSLRRNYGLIHAPRLGIASAKSPSPMDNSPTIAILTVDGLLDEIRRLAQLIKLERRLNYPQIIVINQRSSTAATLQPLSFTTTSSFEQIFLPVSLPPRLFTPQARVRALASFRPVPMPSRFAVIAKLHWLGLDVRSVPRASRPSPSSRTMRRGADSSWRSVLRRARAIRQ